MKPEFFAFLGVYFAILLFLGLKFSRRMKSLEDFFLASRSLSARLVFLSLTASWFGATSILVTTDEAYRVGVSAVWLVGVPALLTVLIFAFLLAGPIRRLPILTLPDLIELHYGKAVRHLASGLIFWYMVVLASSQMVAAGNFFKPFLGVSYFWSLALGTAVVIVYLVSGGLRSVAFTDSFQCLFLSAGMVGLAVFLLRSSSFEAAFCGVDFFFDIKKNLLITLSFTLAWTISPIAWQRVQAARTAEKARQGLFITAAAFVFLYGLVVVIGILARPLFSFRALASPLLAEFIAGSIAPVLGALLFVAVAAAILSTMDTAINTGALTLTRDIYQRIFVPSREAGDGLVLAGRIATFIVATLAFVVATRFQSILRTIGLASEIMTEGLFIPGMAMFIFKKKIPLAGGLSLALGGGFALASFLSELKIFPAGLPAWPNSVPYGLGLSLAGFVAGFLLEKLRQSSH
ncbi:MAG: sodium:solute symporter family protein [Clostridiales bacterium]|nr:sodium:solute symporter family protein [Clostridiales bacterium]